MQIRGVTERDWVVETRNETGSFSDTPPLELMRYLQKTTEKTTPQKETQ
jgi:hypothetical protein